MTGGSIAALRPGADTPLRYDPTGLVKGWAVDVAAEALANVTGISYCINAGGRVLVGGSAAWGPWSVDIEDPEDRSAEAHTIEVEHGAVATSVRVTGTRPFFDPRQPRFATRVGSATVVATSLLWADIWANALLCRGNDAALRLAEWDPTVESYVL